MKHLLFSLVFALVISAVCSQVVAGFATAACSPQSKWTHQAKTFSSSGITQVAITYSGFELYPRFTVSASASSIALNVTFTTNGTVPFFAVDGTIVDKRATIVMGTSQSSDATASRTPSHLLVTGLSALFGYAAVHKKPSIIALFGVGVMVLPWSQAQSGR